MSITAREFFSLDESEYDESVEADFFKDLKMRNGTFKLTGKSRFIEIEKFFGCYFEERAHNIRAALDVGASSGITTAEFAYFLRAHGAQANWTATDPYIRAHIVNVTPGVRVLCDPDGWPLQYDIGGVAVRPWIRRMDYATLAFIPRILARKVLRRRTKALIDRGQSKPVQLISPRLTGREDVEFVEDDILKRRSSFAGRFDLVRAANVLNRNYFSVEHLGLAIGNVHAYLRGPGALFLVTRTNPARQNAGTLFELTDDRTFSVVDRIGGGSEIEDLVLSYRPRGSGERG